MDFVSANSVSSRITSFFAIHAKKATEVAAAYAKLAGLFVETVEVADSASKALRVATPNPDLSAARPVEMTLMYGTLAANLTKVASMAGMPNAGKGEKTSPGLPPAGQAIVVSASGTSTVNQGVTAPALGMSPVGRMATIFPARREEALL